LAKESEDDDIMKQVQDLLGHSYQINYERIVEDHNSHIKENDSSFKIAIDKITEKINYDQQFDETNNYLQKKALMNDLPATRDILEDHPHYKISKKTNNSLPEDNKSPGQDEFYRQEPLVSIWEESHARRSPPKNVPTKNIATVSPYQESCNILICL
jgi:hypothetical protein